MSWLALMAPSCLAQDFRLQLLLAKGLFGHILLRRCFNSNPCKPETFGPENHSKMNRWTWRRPSTDSAAVLRRKLHSMRAFQNCTLQDPRIRACIVAGAHAAAPTSGQNSLQAELSDDCQIEPNLCSEATELPSASKSRPCRPT